MFSYTLVVFSVTLLISSANAGPDCTKKPSSVGKYCCKFPMPNWGAFETRCKAFMPPSTNLCYLECMFNVSNAYEGENFNMENSRIMLTTLFNGNKEFVDAYMLSFNECEPEIKKYVAEFKAKHSGSLPKSGPCRLFGSFYGLCAHEMMMKNCPKSAWNSNGDCEKAKKIATACKPLSYTKH